MNPVSLGSLELLNAPIVRATGWTLVHFLWQGVLVAVALRGAELLLREGSAAARYVAACSALGLLALLPVLTALAFWGLESGGVVIAALPILSGLALPDLASQTSTAWLPFLVVTWLAGVFLLSLRFAGGLALARSLVARTVPLTPELRRRLAAVARRIGVSQPVRFLESAIAEVPLIVGWLKPAVLLPTAVLTGLSPAELEAVVAHELAHVRRRDYLVNLVQSLVEIVLFFHPAVWWVSHRIRVEREHCCDDVAVATCGEALTYARALAALESLRGLETMRGMQPALAATGVGSLLARVRRVVGHSGGRPGATAGFTSPWLGGLFAASAAALFLGAACLTVSSRLGLEPGERPGLGWPAENIDLELQGNNFHVRTLRDGQEVEWRVETAADGTRTETFLIDGQPAPIDEAARLWQEHVLEQKSAILRRPSGIDRATLRHGDGVIEYERIIEND